MKRSPPLRVRDAPDSPGCTWVRQAPRTWAGVNWIVVAWVIAERLGLFAKTDFSCLERETLGQQLCTQNHQGQSCLPLDKIRTPTLSLRAPVQDFLFFWKRFAKSQLHWGSPLIVFLSPQYPASWALPRVSHQDVMLGSGKQEITNSP